MRVVIFLLLFFDFPSAAGALEDRVLRTFERSLSASGDVRLEVDGL